MTSTRRSVFAAAVLTAALAVPAAAAPAPNAPTPAPTRPAARASVVHAGSPTSAVNRVSQFYGAYIDATYDSGRGQLAKQLRDAYLTGALRSRLATWEASNRADGILRAQNVPLAWAVRYDNSGAGHAFTTVRLTWSSGAHPTYTYLSVQSDLATRRISDIKPAH